MTKNKHFGKAILLLSFSLSLLQAAAQDTPSLSGILKNREGQAVPQAFISIEDNVATTFSDDNGHFLLKTVLTPPFKIYVSTENYKFQTISYTGGASDLDITLEPLSDVLNEVAITARRRIERTQDVPIAISVVSGATVNDAGAFNVNRVKELVPSVQLYSSNPRNTTLNIRGLGSTFGLTNDGIDPGVGFYVDGIYYARPAATTLDFIDVERIEVLRGPQGTLFGKNTTAGAFNITTKRPGFTPEATFEASYGNFGYIQAKTSVTGALSKKWAGRISFSGTQRDGLVYNQATDKYVNDLNNLGLRAQLLYKPSERVNILFAGDATRQRPDGYAQVYAGAVQTQRADYRQFNSIIKDLNYSLPSLNPFDRIIDHNTTWRSNNDLGGASVNIDAKIGEGTLTATSAWRYWNWDPSNDRDFTGLAMLSKSQAPSKHQQWSQEIRYAGNISSRISGVIGVYAIYQTLKSDPYHTEEAGDAQWRFSQNSQSPLWQTPGLFDGYGIRTTSQLNSFSGALFTQLDWEIANKLHVLPGLRLNYDLKDVDYNREVYGGLQTDDPALLALLNSVYSNQAFKTNVRNSNISGQLTLSYVVNNNINTYATYSTAYKPIGINLGGLPQSNGEVMIELAEIKPEYVSHIEAGIKSTPLPGLTLNVSVFNTDIKDYQTLVQTAELGVNRGYLANAEKVRVTGAELDINAQVGKYFSFFGALSYTDAKYVAFTNAPVPLEETGASVSFKDISGGKLPGVSKWAGALGGEIAAPVNFIGQRGKVFLALESSFRSSFSSSPSPSQYLNIDGYFLLNGRAGFRATRGTSIFVWSRNLLDKNYFEQLLPGAGNAGHYAAVLGDQRTYGVTLRLTL